MQILVKQHGYVFDIFRIHVYLFKNQCKLVQKISGKIPYPLDSYLIKGSIVFSFRLFGLVFKVLVAVV